jgi:hypothetical protein
MKITGYEINIRQDKKSGEYLAFIPSSYDMGRGRFYMAFTLADGWVEVSPEYATRGTRPVSTFPQNLKRAVDSNMGYILILYPRLVG